ncbi:hypothetical protein WKH24_17860 [Pantoea agglomerans]|uniref:hypothetical protein n=1 Tax=Enterobacter agglomerans TaxID=549 RepID=UPI001F51BAEC|nr:hypothetical protein [Pantoea agglomerans]
MMRLFRRVIFLFIVSGTIIGAAMASENSQPLSQYDSLAKISAIFNNQAVVSSLKSVLGKDYNEFSQNFDVFGEPHKTKEGGLFAEGWLKDLYLEQASAFVIQPDGKIYAAWFSPEINEVHYVSNAPGRDTIQEDIADWAQRFDKLPSSGVNAEQKENSKKERFVETSHFRIKISSLCATDSDCNYVSYEGVRKSDGSVAKLKGKAMKSDCGKNSCPILTYTFRNHDASYIINNVINNFSVIVNGKVVLSETGKWSDVPR